jgi:glutamate-1-semialdehyde aminotransferase
VAVGGKGGINLAATAAGHGNAANDVFTELVWTFALNRGVYLAPAPDLRWTLTVAHGDRDVEALASAVADVHELLGHL